MSNRTGQLVAAVAIAMLALPAAAGSWPNISPRKAPAKANQAAAPAVATPRPIDGFEYIGGEGGWQPAQHKYVRAAGGFAHSEECDHAIRTAKTPTAAELEWNVRLYGGA